MLLVVFVTPQLIGHNFAVMAIILSLCGVTMAGCVPLSALFPALAPDNKGAAVSVLNLGAGPSVFVAPAKAALFFESLGAGGVLAIYAGFYVLSAALTPFLKTPAEKAGGVMEDDELDLAKQRPAMSQGEETHA